MNRTEERNLEARRAAQAEWDLRRQRETEAGTEKELARRADAEKTARLRALRLAAAAQPHGVQRSPLPAPAKRSPRAKA